jgi:hypothetical protein
LARWLPDNVGCPSGHRFPQRPAPRKLRDQQLNMRLIARFVVLMVAVFGVSLAFAWAWDKSDKPQDTSERAAS